MSYTLNNETSKKIREQELIQEGDFQYGQYLNREGNLNYRFSDFDMIIWHEDRLEVVPDW